MNENDPVISGLFSADDVTKEMEYAGMDEARRQFGFGITRTAIRKIFLAMVNARNKKPAITGKQA